MVATEGTRLTNAVRWWAMVWAPGIEAGGDQALAEPEDGGLGLRVDLVGARMWASGARLQGFIATLAVTRQQPIDPAPRDAMAPG